MPQRESVQERIVAFTRDVGLLRQVRREVEPLGAHVVTVDEPQDCIDAVEVSAPLLVVMDDSGDEVVIDLLERVRTRRPSQAVVFATTAHTPSLEKRVRCAGVLYYAVKPLRAGVLGRLAEVIADRKARRRVDRAPAV